MNRRGAAALLALTAVLVGHGLCGQRVRGASATATVRGEPRNRRRANARGDAGVRGGRALPAAPGRAARPPARCAGTDRADTAARRRHHGQPRERDHRRRHPGPEGARGPRRPVLVPGTSRCARPAGPGRGRRGHDGEQPRRRLRGGRTRGHPARRPAQPGPGRGRRPGPRRGLHAVPRARSTAPNLAFFAADASPREGSSPVWEAGAGHARGSPPPAARGRSAPLLAALRATARDEVVVVYLHWGVAEQRVPEPRAGARSRGPSPMPARTSSSAPTPTSCRAPGWLGDTYVAYGLGNFLWYHDHRPDSGVLQLRVEDGRVVSDDWVPAKIQLFGRPLPLRGALAPTRSTGGGHCAAARVWPPGPLPASASERSPRPTTCRRTPRPFTGSDRRCGHACAPPTARDAPCRGPTSATCGCPTSASTGAAHLGEMVVAARHARDVVARLRPPVRRPLADPADAAGQRLRR